MPVVVCDTPLCFLVNTIALVITNARRTKMACAHMTILHVAPVIFSVANITNPHATALVMTLVILIF